MSAFIAGSIVGAALTILIFLIGFMYYELQHKHNPKALINKRKILNSMNQRMDSLSIYLENDYGANITGYHEAHREIRYWRDCINRGLFDEDDIND
jgi:hypothetical protein